MPGLTPTSLTPDAISLALLLNNEVPIREKIPFAWQPVNMRRAAVLVPFLVIQGRWHVLYIRRTLFDGDMHSGQVAFPGGAWDMCDSNPEEVALRETQEEIGLSTWRVRVLGRLGSMPTISSYLITPIVGVVPWPVNFCLAPTEVSRVFTIPLDWLADPANRETRLREVPSLGEHFEVIYFKPYEGELLWGASARITFSLLAVLGLI